MTRTRLLNRRFNVTTTVNWTASTGPDHRLIVTYGFDDQGRIREAFCASFRAGTDICALANDACILFSRLLQHTDESLERIADSLGEDWPEGQTHGPPSSLIGAIARKALEVERGAATKRPGD